MQSHRRRFQFARYIQFMHQRVNNATATTTATNATTTTTATTITATISRTPPAVAQHAGKRLLASPPHAP